MNAASRIFLRRAVWILFCLTAFAGSAAPKTQVQLLLSADAARSGDTIWAGLKMDMAPMWHTYWRNGGEAGDPTKIIWDLPPGVTAGEIHWPVPEKDVQQIGDSALVTYVYTGEVVLLVPLTLAKYLPPGVLHLKASNHWMECSEQCVMASNEQAADLTIASETKPSSAAPLLREWLAKVPGAAAPETASAAWEAGPISTNGRPLIITWKTNLAPADFYPYANTYFDGSGQTETLPAQDSSIRLRKILKTNDNAWPDHLAGILVGKVDSGHPFAQEVDLAIRPAAPAAPAATPPVAGGGAIGLMLGFAFLGGLILNIMPCVLPVIALKILSFVKQAGEHPGRVRSMGFVYGFGVLVSFLVLAGLAIGAQRAGGVANWGDSFRVPQVQMALTILVTLIALNLFGVFEITLSTRATGVAGELVSRSGYSGAFFNGVLATMLATPCTAPFLGAALAFAFSQPPLIIVLVFVAAGVGFAFPFVLLCCEPRWLRWLPKPGAWMEKFKTVLGFPMLGTAVWLMWISANGGNDVLWLGLFLVVLALAAWVWGEFVQRGLRGKGVAAVISLALVAADAGLLLQSRPDKEGIPWKIWSPQAVADAQREGHPVLVDFTAKSCLTCQVNKRTSLEIPRTRKKLEEIGAVALVGDYTREDPAISIELARYHRDGVPLVLVYSKDTNRAPQVLDVFLTPGAVLSALDQAAH